MNTSYYSFLFFPIPGRKQYCLYQGQQFLQVVSSQSAQLHCVGRYQQAAGTRKQTCLPARHQRLEFKCGAELCPISPPVGRYQPTSPFPSTDFFSLPVCSAKRNTGFSPLPLLPLSWPCSISREAAFFTSCCKNGELGDP